VNRKILLVILVAFSAAYFAGCSHTPKHLSIAITTPPPASIAPGASVQIAATETGTKALIDWSCTPANTCGSFSPTSTSSGEATTYTAPDTAGPVTITATSESKGLAPVSVDVTIQANQGIAGAFAFYVTGFDAGQSTYSLAGAVNIAANGTLTGEQDFNNGFGVESPAGGDMITGGSLSVGADGSGTLTLVTNNPNPAVGVNGTETFTVNFVNSRHALIIQSDGSATSSGSLDLQTLPSTLDTNFAFALTGVGPAGFTVTTGGVFSITGGTTINGIVDVNDATLVPPQVNPSLANPFTGTLMPADNFGRGAMTTDNAEIGMTLAYYVIGPEAIRLVVTAPTATENNPGPTAVGSAFGQGSGTFSNASIGNSVFIEQANAGGNLFAAVGQIVPTAGGAARPRTVHPEGIPITDNFTGVADNNETAFLGAGAFVDAASISGTYFIESSGYGNLSITMANGTAGGLLDINNLGIYMVDPSVNVNDPNNSSGGGGAVIVDLDVNLAGVGVLVPQTATTGFAGNYALGLQDLIPTTSASGEVDFVGNAVAGANLVGSGTLSDPGDLFGLGTVDAASFSAPITADTTSPATAGRYEISPFTITVNGNGAPIMIPEIATAYEASAAQLFWIEDGADGQASVFGGQIQATSTLGAAAAKRVKKP
jgi:hypothetical protein